MQLKNWISLFLVLAMIIGAGARIIQVNTEQEALSAITLASNETITKGNCEVLEVKKIVESAGDIGKDWEIIAQLNYSQGTEQLRKVFISSAKTNDETTIKETVAVQCEELFKTISPEKTTVEIKATTPSQKYNLTTKRWE